MQAGFLPDTNLQMNSLLLFGLLLLTGVMGGHLARAALGLPRIVGFLAAGMLLGPSVLGWLDAQMTEDAQVFVDIGLGLVLYELGGRLDLRWFVRDRWLAATGIAEAALAFALVYIVLAALGAPSLIALLLGAAAMSTAPAVVTLLVRDLHAEGLVTERVLAFTALNNVLAFLASAVLLPIVHLEHAATWETVLLHPAYLLAGSLLVGLVLAAVGLRIAAWFGKQEGVHFVLIVGLVITGVGAAMLLKLPVVLTLLAFGVLVRNLDKQRVLMPVDFGRGAELFIIVLFVVAGARLRISGGYELAWVAPVFIIARFAGKFAGVAAFAHANTMSLGRAWNLSLALLPLSGTTLYLVAGVERAYPGIGTTLASALVPAVAVLEMAGPIAAQWGFKHAGEAHPEKS